jgi:hypothetical protein
MTHITIEREALQTVLDTLEENHHLIEQYERSEYLALYDRQITVIKQALAAQPATPLTDEQILNLAENCTAQHHDLLSFGRAVLAAAQPAPVQSCYYPNCETQGKEIQALKSTNDRLMQAITKTVDENLHLADGDNCTLVHLVRALGPDDPGREAPLTREELRAMWIKRETGWDFYINVDARLFGRKDATNINPPKDTNV